ncbi:hypothetical protein ACT17S_11255 [Glutamicibacter mysorens]
MQWVDLFTHWNLIEADLHQFYSIDIESGVLSSRTYRWLITRVAGLFAVEHSRLRLKIYPPEKNKQPGRPSRRR